MKLEIEDVKITIRTASSNKTQFQQMTVPVSVPQASLPQAATVAETIVDAEPVAEVPASDNSKYITIKSPIIGTFYRRPSPDKPIFAEVGQTIAEGDVLCIIEAMKLFNEIESDVSGKIVKILVDDSSPVEFDQPLFLVDPS